VTWRAPSAMSGRISFFCPRPAKASRGCCPRNDSQSTKYQALNQLALRGLLLALEAYRDDPVEFFLFENVPRIATRGRHLLDQIEGLLTAYGYAVAETTHDCGELGNLAQSRKRFLLVARHTDKVPPFLYEPVKRPLRAVGDVLGKMLLPGDLAAGPMHRVPALHWKTWVRLAFVEAGADWRSLQKLRVEGGFLADYAIAREYHPGVLGVTGWDQSAGVVTGGSRPNNGKFSVADPRVDGHVKSVQLGVRRWDQVAAVVKGDVSVGTGPYAVSDPRLEGLRHNNVFRIVRWDEVSPAVTGGAHPTAGGLNVADPRAAHAWDGSGKYRVNAFDEAAGTVIAESGTGNGAFAVADPRPRNCPPLEAAGRNYQTSGSYGVVPWDKPAGVVSANGQHDNSAVSVADPRLPGLSDRLVCVIRARDETWHRPFTTLELAALQSLVDPEEKIELDGLSDSAWRERIGNAVPPEAAEAVGGVIGTTLLLAWTGETFALGSTPIWVRDLGVALSVAPRVPS
jgi:site-specific DNA-cytosine methylase